VYPIGPENRNDGAFDHLARPPPKETLPAYFFKGGDVFLFVVSWPDGLNAGELRQP
jgi:hypothetical protein